MQLLFSIIMNGRPFSESGIVSDLSHLIPFSADPVELDRTLFQDYHLLRGHIVCRLQRIEVGTASHLFSRLRPSIPVDGTISSHIDTCPLET